MAAEDEELMEGPKFEILRNGFFKKTALYARYMMLYGKLSSHKLINILEKHRDWSLS